jgi:hypothetical protein
LRYCGLKARHVPAWAGAKRRPRDTQVGYPRPVRPSPPRVIQSQTYRSSTGTPFFLQNGRNSFGNLPSYDARPGSEFLSSPTEKRATAIDAGRRDRRPGGMLRWQKDSRPGLRCYRGKYSTTPAKAFTVRLILREHGSEFPVRIDARSGLWALLPQPDGEKAEQLFLFLRRKAIGGSFDFGKRTHRADYGTGFRFCHRRPAGRSLPQKVGVNLPKLATGWEHATE